MTTEDRLADFDATGDDIELVNEKALTWFDVSAIGTGEMLFTAGWAWIMYVAASYGTKWLLIGFVGGAAIIHLAWWLYREMITAVPEPGSLQSFAREAGIFSVGTTYFVGYTAIYGAFLWLELIAAKGLLSAFIPGVPTWIWPFVVIAPVVGINLMGHQITGKFQSILVIVTLIGDLTLAILFWHLLSDRQIWASNWESPTQVNWMTPFAVTGMWIGVMAGIMEVQQVLVDEWSDFRKCRDVGLLSAAWQLWVREVPLALGLLAAAPVAALALMPVPAVEVVHERLGQHPVFYLAIAMMLVATFTTISVYFMAMAKVLALYAQQGALPRVVGRYSSRSVPWVAIMILAAFALAGSFFTNFDFIVDVLSEWSATLYFVVALFFLGMRRRKDLDRPVVAAFGVPVAYIILAVTTLVAVSVFLRNWQAGIVWYGACGAFIAYDHYIVPRTKRGGFYRAQVLRRRTSAVRL
jgi:amino acid transporter